MLKMMNRVKLFEQDSCGPSLFFATKNLDKTFEIMSKKSRAIFQKEGKGRLNFT